MLGCLHCSNPITDLVTDKEQKISRIIFGYMKSRTVLMARSHNPIHQKMTMICRTLLLETDHLQMQILKVLSSKKYGFIELAKV